MRRRWLRIGNITLTLVLAVLWWNTYRPQLLGGPAAYAVVSGESMESTLVDGDLVITRRRADYAVGDVVAYRVPPGYVAAGVRVVHRIVGGTAESGYVTQGDNRVTADPWRVFPRDVIGSVSVRIPRAGAAVAFLREPPIFAWLVGSILLMGIWALDRRRRSATLGA